KSPGMGKGAPVRARRFTARLMMVVVIPFPLIAFPVAEVAAQTGGHGAPGWDDRADTPGWVSEFTVLGFNAVLGGLTAGIRQWRSGRSFSDGCSRGFRGGGVVYAWKRSAAERCPSAGLIGRGVAGAGGSIVRNAS